ncbi:hypothetical protein GGR56DRAFT_423668 [Xylariaceae sp. FL0804]|nr:hypothetical protein GGR56DRAFT_423668 [Xylariaceae sp. FL0804]
MFQRRQPPIAPAQTRHKPTNPAQQQSSSSMALCLSGARPEDIRPTPWRHHYIRVELEDQGLCDLLPADQLGNRHIRWRVASCACVIRQADKTAQPFSGPSMPRAVGMRNRRETGTWRGGCLYRAGGEWGPWPPVGFACARGHPPHAGVVPPSLPSPPFGAGSGPHSNCEMVCTTPPAWIGGGADFCPLSLGSALGSRQGSRSSGAHAHVARPRPLQWQGVDRWHKFAERERERASSHWHWTRLHFAFACDVMAWCRRSGRMHPGEVERAIRPPRTHPPTYFDDAASSIRAAVGFLHCLRLLASNQATASAVQIFGMLRSLK